MTGSSESHRPRTLLFLALFFTEWMVAAGNFMILFTGVAVEAMSMKCSTSSSIYVFSKLQLVATALSDAVPGSDSEKKPAVIFSLSGLERDYNSVYLAAAVQWCFMSACYSFMNTWLPELCISAACATNLYVWHCLLQFRWCFFLPLTLWYPSPHSGVESSNPLKGQFVQFSYLKE